MTDPAVADPTSILPSRRAFLVGAVSAAGLALLDPRGLASARKAAAALPAGDLFGLGVASGDPTASSVILWTRLLAPGGAALPAADVAVEWEVATDAAFTAPVASGTAAAVAALAHSVHVDVTGLAPDGVYHYRFTVDGRTSPVGRTTTFPGDGVMPGRVRFALASCQNWTDGYYTAHAGIAAEDISFVVFVGDYIYENSNGRPPRPITLAESKDIPTYRARYELYKADPNLQAAHARAPWIVTVDDHEVANNMIADVGKNGDAEGDPAAIAAWLARRADAYQVWYEHQPVRLPAPTSASYRIHRTVDHSDLLRFFVLDGRQYRSTYPSGISQDVDDPQRYAQDRTMLGLDQESWLDGELASTTAHWNVVAQQTVMTATPVAVAEGVTFFNFDQWDGYVAARNRLLASLVTNAVSNPVVLSGDIHLAAAAAVRFDYQDPAAPDIAHEIVTTSITSRFDPDLLSVFESSLTKIPWARYGNARERGYALITVTPDAWTTEFRVVDVKVESAEVRTDFTDVVASRVPVAVTVPPPQLPPTTGPGAVTPVDPGQPSDPGQPGSPGLPGFPGTPPTAVPVGGAPSYTG